MGLFDFGEKKRVVESEIRDALSNVKVLDYIMLQMVELGPDWFRTCESYYDDRVREVIILPDLFRVKWKGYEYESLDENDKKCMVYQKGQIVDYRYTDSGYVPLHSHINEKDWEDVSRKKVLYLWGHVVRDRMKTEMPELAFDEVMEYGEYVTFRYEVPRIGWKKWF